MKRILLFVCLAAALRMTGLMPFSGNDVADLVPVEALTVDWKRGQVVLDSGESQGYGADWAEALEDLHRGADGTVFLGTAEQVVLSEAAVRLLPDVIRSQQLRPAAVICVCTGPLPKPKDAAAYLSAHDAGMTIQKVRAAMVRGEGVALPVLRNTEGGLRLNGSKNR